MKKYIAYTLVVAMLLLIGINVYALYHFDKTSQKLQTLRDDRFIMVQKANELRQSSNDLSRFARTYTVTGNKKYKDNYFSVLDIREGKKARPYYYENIYWDLLEPVRSQRHRDKEAVSLQSQILKLPYTESELSMLNRSKKLSDNLVNMEVEAFASMDGKFRDSEGNYTHPGVPDPKKALSILYSKRYHIEKSKIMLPIDDFLFSVTHRTSLEIKKLQDEISVDFYIFKTTLLLLLLFLVYFVYAVLKKGSKDKPTT